MKTQPLSQREVEGVDEKVKNDIVKRRDDPRDSVMRDGNEIVRGLLQEGAEAHQARLCVLMQLQEACLGILQSPSALMRVLFQHARAFEHQ